MEITVAMAKQDRFQCLDEKLDVVPALLLGRESGRPARAL